MIYFHQLKCTKEHFVKGIPMACACIKADDNCSMHCNSTVKMDMFACSFVVHFYYSFTLSYGTFIFARLHMTECLFTSPSRNTSTVAVIDI